MSDERDLLRALRTDPDDRASRMVYADLLEQRGEHGKAEMLRLQATFDPDRVDDKREKKLRVLAQTVDADWRAETARRAIDFCDGVKPSFRCPKKWESLATIAGGDADVRHCNVCDREVFFCTSLSDVKLHGAAKQCVAFDATLVRGDARSAYEAAQFQDDWMGEVAVEEPPPIERKP